jgi:hypothetical protein
MDEGIRILHIDYVWCVNESFTCHKILRHGTSGFASHPKEGVLRIFISLKNPWSWQGLNPRPLGPVAHTLTTTPPWRLKLLYTFSKYSFWWYKCLSHYHHLFLR